jgi:hypothetical protein
MIVSVTYSSIVLGSGEFWRGTADQTGSIRNIVARDLAKKVFGGQVATLTAGMWTATRVEP